MKKRLAYNPYRVKSALKFVPPEVGTNGALEQSAQDTSPKAAVAQTAPQTLTDVLPKAPVPPVRPEAAPVKGLFPPVRPEVSPRTWLPPTTDADSRALMIRVPPPKQSDFSVTRICGKCGSRSLQDEAASFWQKCFLARPYSCLQCSARHTRFKFSGFVLITLMFIGGLSYAGVYVYEHPILIGLDRDTHNSADALARSRSEGLSAYEAMMLKKPRTTLDNASILRLWKANVGASVIVKMIQTSNPDYDLNANAVIELQQAGVDQAIIVAMIDATYASR